MSFAIQNYRSLVSGEAPEGLLPGQVAFNLADMFQFIGYGGDVNYDVDGNPVLPAPPAGEGWKAYPLSGGGGGGSVTDVTGVSPVSVVNGTSTPVISVNAASTTTLGVVQLTDSTTSPSSTTALTAAGAKNLQDQISALSSSSNLTLAGTIDGSTGFMATVTTQGTATGFVVGSALPAAASGNSEYFAIVTTAGNMTPPGGVATDVHPGDWWLSTGTAYQLIDSGQATAVPATPFGFGTVYGCTTSSSGTVNTFLGFRAGRCIVTGGAGNVLLGNCAGATLATGTDNVFVGVFAGRSVTDSQYNTFIGSQAGRSQSGGYFNTFTGAGSGFGSSGCDNTFIGYGTGNNYRGDGNTALGAQSLQYSDTGACFNTALGAYSLGQSGSYTPCKNVAVGYCSAIYTEGCNNVAIGYNVQLPVASASCQLAIGFEDGQFWLTGDSTKAIKPGAGIIDCAGSTGTAGQVLTSNGANAICWGTGVSPATPTALGTVYALSNNTSNNVALGFNAGKSITTGGNNTFIGENAGCSNLGAFSITAVGLNAGCALVNGNNTVIGVNSGKSLVSGNFNLLVGEDSGCSLVTGTSNTHIGQAAGINDVASYNTFIGHEAGRCSTTGCFNVAVGQSTFAQVSTNTASAVTALGQGALRQTSGTGGSTSVAVGTNAGCQVSTGINNTLIGCGGGINLTTGSNNVAIGFNSRVASPTGNCQLVIGNNTSCWLTGNSTFAIRPGAGIIDCASSTGTAGQVLMSNGSNAICWGAAGGASAATPTVAGIVLGCTTNLNSALGSAALFNNTTGSGNTATGYQALVSNTSGLNNVANGNGALLSNTLGLRNTATGYQALCNNINGSSNTAIGNQSGSCITSGSFNVAIGDNTQVVSPTGSCQLAIGFSTTANWLTGTSTKAIKPGAGIIDCANSCGTAGQVLMSNGSNAVCWGAAPSASAATTSVLGTVYGCDIPANSSVYIGNGAGTNGTSCSNNTALGNNAMGMYSAGVPVPACVVGSIAIGQWALAVGGSQTPGCNVNTIAIGNRALGSGGNAASGTDNIFIGNFTGVNKGSGDFNTVVGSGAGSSSWTANCGCNTFVGFSAGLTTTGSNNTAIGYCAQPVTAASNSVTLGNASVTTIRAAVTTITAISDARDKTDITALPVGLDFINSLNPVKFTWQMREPNEVKDGTSEAGFIAQDLQTAQNAAEADYLGLVYDQDPEKLEASAGKLIPVLVKALQELSDKNDFLESRIAQLERNFSTV